MTIISAAAGVVISLRSPTVREAQQTLMAVIMFPGLLLGVAGTLALTVESLRETITTTIDKINPIVLLLVVTVMLSGVCFFLLRLTRKRFQRDRLVID